MKPIINFLLPYLVVLFASCERDNCHETIMFKNNSLKPVYITAEDSYPDTLFFQHYSGLVHNSHTQKVEPNSINTEGLRTTPSCWENVINGARITSDTLMIYVFDADDIENLSWTEVTQNYLVLKRYDLSLSDLEEMNWTITYP